MRQPIKIGILAHRGSKYALSTWEATAAYLTGEVSGYSFEIIPLDFNCITAAVEQRSIEFVITNSGLYVEFEALYGVNRLATLKHLRQGKPYTVFGGVIFCKATRQDLKEITYLRGQRFMAVAEKSLGGWRAAWREIVEAGINPYRDFQSLQFGDRQDAVVEAVYQGIVDAGTVATDMLERIASEGMIDLQDFKVIQPKNEPGFPFALSTRLYPEWPFAVLPQVTPELAEQVAIALLKLPKDSPAAKAAKSEGWTIPLNYQSVHECFQALQVHPYKDFGKISSSFELAVKGSNDGLWDWNLETNEVFFSARWKQMLGYAVAEIPDHFHAWEQRLHADDRDRVLASFQSYFARNNPTFELEYRLKHRDGSYCWILCRGILLRDVLGNPYRMAGSHTDITNRKQSEEELRQALRELQQAQLQLIHSEKMSSLGLLVAGVAHEINNPVNFIYGNLNYIETYIQDMLRLIYAIQQYYPQPPQEVQTLMEEIDLDFLQVDIPKLLHSMHVGANRIRQIVLSLRNFSRLDEANLKEVDIHEGIDNTLLILQHRLKPRPGKFTIQVLKNYGNLPLIKCYPGQLNQVFMNILSNAIDVLELCILKNPPLAVHHYQSRPHDVSENSKTNEEIASPIITIGTRLLERDRLLISIADNGPGMPEEIRTRIFDPFFTTKPVGHGTGLGLSISYQIITEQHRGKIGCNSQPNRGTEFWIELPMRSQIPG